MCCDFDGANRLRVNSVAMEGEAGVEAIASPSTEGR
jgi:hypothetical protein